MTSISGSAGAVVAAPPGRPAPGGGPRPLLTQRRGQVPAALLLALATACGSAAAPPTARAAGVDDIIGRLRAAGLPCDRVERQPPSPGVERASCVTEGEPTPLPCPQTATPAVTPAATALSDSGPVDDCPQGSTYPVTELGIVYLVGPDETRDVAYLLMGGSEPETTVAGDNFYVLAPAGLARQVAQATGGRIR